LNAILQLLREHKLYAKLIKCEFFNTLIQYLGHVISKGVVVDPENINTIMEWLTPRNVTEVILFMGLT